jgi:membrane protein implicated in regulation of membrane protease activity
MSWSLATWWWIVTGVLVAAELATGTFYLLMLALGASAAALAAHLGLGFSPQLLIAAAVGGGAVALWHWKRGRQPAGVPASENRDVILDIGEQVHIADWDADSNASTQYRGARWSVHYAGSGLPRPGLHVIRRIEGSRLFVERPVDRPTA